MKRISFILIGLILASNAFTQEVVAVAATKFNILYVGVDNPIKIAVENVKDKDVSVSVNPGKIEKTGTPEEVLSEDQLTTSYSCRLFVDKNPVTEKPRVNLIPDH